MRKIIDFHTHIFPEQIAGRTIEKLESAAQVKACADGTLNGLRRSMERAGVQLSIILPVVTKPEQFFHVNQYADELNQEYSKDENCQIISFGGLHPDTENYKEELKEIKRLGLKGIKLHPDYQRRMIDDAEYMRIIDFASELGLIISVHAGIDIGLPEPVHCTPRAVRRVLREAAPENLVLAHTGGFGLWDEVEEFLVGEKVFFDTSYTFGFMPDEQFLRIVNMHGEDKILFATDSPWGAQKETAEHLEALPLAAETKNKIFCKNSEKLLAI